MSITSLLEQKMLPLAEKISSNIYLTALKNAFIALIPFLIVGSFFLLSIIAGEDVKASL